MAERTDLFRAYRIEQEESNKPKGRMVEIGLSDLNEGELVLRTRYSNLNYKNALAATGARMIARRLPIVGGIDVAGIVEISEEDAHAMEQSISKMLCSMISTTDDPEIRSMLEHHKQETEEHERRLRERLDALGAGTSTRKQAQTIATALMKGVGDMARTDKPAKNARDGFVTEHMEKAAYHLLERLANKAGDERTAEVARQNRADEEAMARKIHSNWDRFLDLTLATPGVLAE
jgi:ferritin-like metal-binding protein YciE